jgi:16S rRNA (cytosine1402-N4)-methyltransferase
VTTSQFEHAPVLLSEVLQHMQIKPDGCYVDGTYGRGGHASSILAQLGESGRLVVMDKDPDAIKQAKVLLGADSRVTILHDDYENLSDHIDSLGFTQQIDGVLLDLGVSSPQLDDAERGFSFQRNGPLDMRMNPEQGQSASDWLAKAEETEIARVLWEYGEERGSRRIAKRIIEAREEGCVDDTATLAALISACIPQGKNHKHPATRSFQAIRIHINQELEHIHKVLDSIFDVLKVGGRLQVISFHSLEDRVVKRFFKKHSTRTQIPRGLPVRDSEIASNIRFALIGKAIKASDSELKDNPRARSAVLRVAERTA